MADSKKGKQKYKKTDSHIYTYQGMTQLFHPSSSRPVSLIEFYLAATKNKKIKALSGSGKDVTKEAFKRAEAAWQRQENANKTKELKALRQEERRKKETGYYCDCVPSSIYKTPEDVPENMHEMTLEKVSYATLVPINKDGTCKFCGHYATFSTTAITGRKCPNNKMKFKKNLDEKTKKRYENDRRKYAEKKEEGKGPELPETILDAVRRSLAADGVPLGTNGGPA